MRLPERRLMGTPLKEHTGLYTLAINTSDSIDVIQSYLTINVTN